ncbi:MAG: hypothetical protein ACFFFB_20455 [Candidatus Heimdallarchaeota archaeon]
MFILFDFIKINQSADELLKDFVTGLENWCIAFNDFCFVFYKYIKFIFVFIIISIGVLTLLRLRGVYRQSRLINSDKKTDTLRTCRLVLGCTYIFLGLGILFNYLTYFIIWILDPLPDRMIYNFIDLISIDPFNLNVIMDISASQYPHEQTLYYSFSLISLISVLDILLSLWYLINNNRLINNPSRAVAILISGVMGGILFGFTTYLPFFI